jgi:uncharacterized protein (DUF736 family)
LNYLITYATILPIQAINNDYISVSLAQPLSAGLGRSIQIDLKDAIKTKINLIKDNSKRKHNSNYIIYILLNYLQHLQQFYQFKQLTNDYISVSLAQPLSAGLGRSIQFDLKDNVKSVISNAHQYARRDEANVFWQYKYLHE